MSNKSKSVTGDGDTYNSLSESEISEFTRLSKELVKTSILTVELLELKLSELEVSVSVSVSEQKDL